MDNQNTIVNLKTMREMTRSNTTVFNMAIAHLFSCGMDNFTEETYAAALNSIKEKHKQAKVDGVILFMTMEFETALLDMAYQLSKYPLFDVLLHIKKDMVIHDPEAIEADDEDIAED